MTVIPLEPYRQRFLDHLASTAGVGKFAGARVVDGKVVLSSSLDDECLMLSPAAARILGLSLGLLADVAEREGG